MKETTLCWRCGKEVPYQKKLRAYCKECKALEEKEQEETKREYSKLKTMIMFENALKCMESQNINMHYYYEACQVVKEKALKDTNTFDSSVEMMVCIELINNQIKVTPQKEFRKYKVDFMLPDLKIILEVDGYLHNSSNAMLKDAKRDIEILNELGQGWEVIRLKTSQIENKLIYLVDDLKKIYKERQELRKKYNGILPDGYNDYTKILYKDMLGLYKYDEAYLTETNKQEIRNSIELKCYTKGKKNSDYDKIKNYFTNRKANEKV
jgi:very-short-patch-repair endonuclease